MHENIPLRRSHEENFWFEKDLSRQDKLNCQYGRVEGKMGIDVWAHLWINEKWIMSLFYFGQKDYILRDENRKKWRGVSPSSL